jgi:drug/metabolite transporter (DMT)-like permease
MTSMPPPAIHKSMTATEWGLLVLLATLWGGSYFYIGVAVQALPPLFIVAFRVTLGAALLYLVVRLSGQRMPTSAAAWGAFFVMGLTNNVIPFSLISWAQGHVPSGFAAILNATTPIFAVILANLLTVDEKMTPGRLAGVVIGFLGVAVMIGPDALEGATDHLLADLALLVASVFYAFSPIYGRRFSRAGLTPMAAATGQFTAAAVMMVPLTLIFDAPWTLPMPGLPVWGALLGLAAGSTAFAYIIYYRILATAGAVNLMLVTFLVPVSAIILGTLFLGERLAPVHFLGMAVIGLGLAAIDGRPAAYLRRKLA